MWGKWSWYPLRWSDAYFTSHESVAPLALNPALFFLDTMDGKGERYDEKIVRENYASLVSLLGVAAPDARTLSFGRQVPVKAGAPRRPLNLVVIHLESFAAFKTGTFGNRLDPTPNFDALARDGVLFTHFFVPATPTARSVFTMLTGVPDYNGVRTASRNPMIVNQHTLINALTDHDRYYFLGGSAAWGNIRGILSHNIHRLQVFEEGNYEAERADAWGVTDLDLLEKAHRQFAASPKPFFAFIQTSGNHRPYTIPDNNLRGFERVTADDKALHDNSFESLAAYNGIRFFDHALGNFFAHARRSPYFRDTVFVMYGDHGNPSVKDIPYERMGLTGFHVPLLIYAPGLIAQGRKIETVASLVDLLPTALGLMGVPYYNQTLGRDLLVARPASERFALIPDGLLDDEFLYREGPDGRPRLYRYRDRDPARDLHEQYPEKVRDLKGRRVALYETARYLLHHNPPYSPDGVARRVDRGATASAGTGR
jgi:phosphoglycerol transferase MdoB-like AlkP superfamily enzyme